MDWSDPKSDPGVATHTTNVISATHTTNRISTQKLLINPTTQVVVGPITPLVADSLVGARESLRPCQTVLPRVNVTDAARNCVRIYRTPGKLIGTERDCTTPRDTSSSKTSSRLSFQIPGFVVTSISPDQFRDQNIVNPSHPGSIVKRDRSAEPFDPHINVHPDKNSESTRFFSRVVGLEAVSGEVSDVDTSKRMNFVSDPILGETPKFMDFWLSTVNTADKLNSVFAPVTREEGLTDHSDWLLYRHSIAEVTEVILSEVQEYSDYIKNSEFETRNVSER